MNGSNPTRPRRLADALYVGSVFVSAFLLFLVQPLAAKFLLPQYGGSPAVWNTALVFFQVLLVGGYYYAHRLSRWAVTRTRWLVHLVVLLLPLGLLPPEASSELELVTQPQWRLLLSLTVRVGAPYFVLSSNASLIQHWWSRRDAVGSDDPYWLYAASNFGSLVALLAYVFAFEPALSVPQQSLAWAGLYAVFVAFTMAALASTMRSASLADAVDDSATPRETTGVALGWARKLSWAVRAAVASSLLLSCSMQISSDVAPTPLLWVLPLALYLVTFVVAFAAPDRVPRTPVMGATVVLLCAAVGMLIVRGRNPFWVVLPVSLGVLFCGALLCHRDLSADRPGPAELTTFYLWICLGGAAGGVLNGLLAPWLFDSIAELPLTLIALALLLYWEPGAALKLSRQRLPVVVGVLAAMAFIVPIAIALRDAGLPAMLLALAGVMAAGWVYAAWRYPWVAGVSIALPCAMLLLGRRDSIILAEERSFFGVVQVRDEGDAIEMAHGNTMHGRQLKDPARRRTPMSYFYPDGPLGSLVAAAPSDARIGVVGLGTGALAAVTKPGQELVFYEIDPLVVKFAKAHFSYVADAPAKIDIVVGDGRLALAREERAFDLLIIDAFSSDFVPIHMLTDEAITLFLSKTTDDGLLALHISNRHADLRRVVKGYAEAHRQPLLFADYRPDEATEKLGAVPTLAAVLSKRPAVLDTLAQKTLWLPAAAQIPTVHWRDDHAGILSVLR